MAYETFYVRKWNEAINGLITQQKFIDELMIFFKGNPFSWRFRYTFTINYFR